MTMPSPQTSEEKVVIEQPHVVDGSGSDVKLGIAPEESALRAERTSKSEIYAWWIYFCGYAPLSIVAIQVLISVILTKYSIARSINPETGEQCQQGEVCRLFKFGSISITPLSFSYLITFISIFSQGICFAFTGALADYGSMRKRLLVICTLLGSVFTISFGVANDPKRLWLAAVISVLISVVYGAALVFYNAYLPLLINNHASLRSESDSNLNGNSALTKDQLASKISTKGIIAGYSSALIVLIISALLILFIPINGIAAYAVSFTGLWWFMISMPSLYYFRERKGAPLPENTSYLRASVQSIRNALGHVRRLPDTMRFLLAYMLVSGSMGTIGYAAVTFATKELGISEQGSLLAVIVLLVSSMIGAFLFMIIQQQLQLSSLRMCILLVMLDCLIPIYGTIGIFSKKIGFRNLWEAYLLAGFHGFVIGAAQSFSRVAFSELVPKGRESECFTLFAVTERIGSSLGILMMTFVESFLKETRWCFVSLAIMMITPIPLMIKGVDFDRGRRNAAQAHI